VAVREKHILTPDQVSRLMDVISEPVRAMVWLCLFTGLRIGEVLGLPWKNVDSTSGQIRVTQGFYREPSVLQNQTRQTPRFDPDCSQNGSNQAARELEAR
jgi:integrase